MRIVYDDEMAPKLADLFNSFMQNLAAGGEASMKAFVRYSWGTDRVDNCLFDKAFNHYLNQHNFEIGKQDIDTSGIGNNCRYHILYTGNPKEKQIAAIYNSIHGMYGEAYIYITNYDQDLIAPSYELHLRGVKISKP